MGISTTMAGKLTFFWRPDRRLSGVLIAPITTVYYDTGFLIGLKGFVAAIIGGLASYPLAAARRPAGGPARILLLLLGQRLQGSHRVHPDHPGAAVALLDHPPCGGGRMMSPPLLVLAGASCPASGLPPVVLPSSTSPCSTTSACIPWWPRPGAAHRGGRPHVLRPGAFVGPGGLHHGYLTTAPACRAGSPFSGASPWLGCWPACC
jgi:hypothetical protein